MVQVPFNILRLYRHRDYYVEICADQEYEAWLYRKKCGIKMFMFGIDIENVTLDEFVDIVESNLDLQIDIYENQFLNEKR